MSGVSYTDHYTNADERLSQRVLHRARRAAVHAGDDMAVSVQVSAMEACPRSSWTYLGWTFLLSSSVAQVWRRS